MVLGWLRRFGLRRSQRPLDDHLQVFTADDYAQALARVTQEVFKWEPLDKACKELAREATDPEAIWFEAGSLVHALLRYAIHPIQALQVQACQTAAAIFARNAAMRELPDGQLNNFLAAFEARVAQYQAALDSPDSPWRVPRMLASSIGVTDPFPTLRFGAVQIPLLGLLKDAVSHLHFTPPIAGPGA